MTDNDRQASESPLESWKQIASYVKRDIRTVKRWEKSEGLPVRRRLHQARSTAYAYRSELDAWWASHRPASEKAMPWQRPALAMVAALLLVLVSAGSARLLHPAGISAQEPSPAAGLTVRRVWTPGGYVGLEGSSVSPDGRYLTFTDWTTGDLAIHDLVSGQSRRLTNKGPWSKVAEFAESFARFSADAKWVAYTWDRKGYEVRVINVDGSASRLVYRNEDWEVLAYDWSPDGQYVAAVLPRDSTSELVLISAVDGSVRKLKALNGGSPARMAFSPDGRFLAYDFPARPDSPKRDIYILPVDGGEELPLVAHPADDYLLGWTPDGQALLFSSDRTGTTGAWLLAVKEGKPQGAPQLVRADLGEGILPLGLTRSGSFYYASWALMRETYTATLDLAKNTLADLPAPASAQTLGSNAGPDWSPDGKFLAYIHGGLHVQPESIVICSLETGEERHLSPKTMKDYWTRGSGDRYLRWSPDGRQLLVNGTDDQNRHGLFLIDTGTGEASPLVTGRRPRYGRWAPDGKAVFYARLSAEKRMDEIVRRDLESGRETVLYNSHAPFQNISSLELSPDGRWLAFSGFVLEKDSGDETVLMVMPAEGGVPKQLLKAPESEWVKVVGWTPDSQEILFSRNPKTAREPSTTIWRVSLAGGEPRKLELGMNVLNDIRFHPDGRRVAFDSGGDSAEIWVMENFLPRSQAAH